MVVFPFLTDATSRSEVVISLDLFPLALCGLLWLSNRCQLVVSPLSLQRIVRLWRSIYAVHRLIM